ncbi:hypothetical protein MN608_05902 [Microdochium nivale]|nr:hypothetical protein MN608_05902 [Microdochium nivale]
MAELNWFQKLSRARTPGPPSSPAVEQPGSATPTASSSSSASAAAGENHHDIITAVSAANGGGSGSSSSRVVTPTTTSSLPPRRPPLLPSKKASYMSLRSRKVFSADPADHHDDDEPHAVIFVRERDNLCCPPKVEELAGSVQNVLLSRGGASAPLPVEYNANVLHVVDGLFKAQADLRKSEGARAEMGRQYELERREWLELADEWMAREQQYKAEVKRLELALSQISPKGVEAVAVARSNSIIDRSGTKRMASRIQHMRESPKRVPSSDKQLETRPKSSKSISENSDASSERSKPGKFKSFLTLENQTPQKILEQKADVILSDTVRRWNKKLLSRSDDQFPPASPSMKGQQDDWRAMRDESDAGSPSSGVKAIRSEPFSLQLGETSHESSPRKGKERLKAQSGVAEPLKAHENLMGILLDGAPDSEEWPRGGPSLERSGTNDHVARIHGGGGEKPSAAARFSFIPGDNVFTGIVGRQRESLHSGKREHQKDEEQR